MNDSISILVKSITGSTISQTLVLRYLDQQLKKSIYQSKAYSNEKKGIKDHKYLWATSLLKNLVKNYNRGYIDREIIEKLSTVMIEGAFHEDQKDYTQKKEAYFSKYGVYPPSFLVISPSKRCNLKCTGCYASSNADCTPTLSYDVVKDLVQEFHDECDGRFIVESGGEPLMYKSGDKTLLDLAEDFPDVFFMFYTNSTLITPEIAKRLHQLGNMIPCISVEGFEVETDERRGKGVFQKILKAMKNLREAKVPFATSVTSTSKNTELLLQDQFYDYFFETQGCSFMWQFQFMPIGRGKDIFKVMPTPEQRVKLYRKWEYLIKEKKYCVADFWNSGVLCKGCVAYGREGGYVYIDWNGNVMPCVFVPYVADNLLKARQEGRNLASILKSPILKNGRKWQHEYILDHYDKPSNILMPCSIRDHFDNFYHTILPSETTGEDEVATSILTDKTYYDNMCQYDAALAKLFDPIWDKDYLNK